jgi:hypothetical protein
VNSTDGMAQEKLPITFVSSLNLIILILGPERTACASFLFFFDGRIKTMDREIKFIKKIPVIGRVRERFSQLMRNPRFLEDLTLS